MKTLRLPPRIKVLEALGAIADERIKLLSDKKARVVSSDGSREYSVHVDLEKGVAYSSDNGTRLRGYVGYPIIAFLMLRGILPYDPDIAKAMKGVPWRMLNERYKRYSIVESIVKERAKKMGIDPSYVDGFVDRVMEELRRIRLRYVERA